MKIKDEDFLQIMDKLDKFTDRLENHKLNKLRSSDREALCSEYRKKEEVR